VIEAIIVPIKAAVVKLLLPLFPLPALLLLLLGVGVDKPTFVCIGSVFWTADVVVGADDARIIAVSNVVSFVDEPDICWIPGMVEAASTTGVAIPAATDTEEATISIVISITKLLPISESLGL
jgi:hypothetical protein